MKRKIVIAAVTTAALLGGGSVAAFAAGGGTGQSDTSSARAVDHDDQDDDSGGEADDAGEARVARSAGTTAAEAAEAALKTAPGTVTSIDLLDDAKGAVWEVDLTQGGTSHEVRLDGDTNKVLSDKTEKDGDKVPDSKLTAADVARKAADRGTVTAVEFGDDSSTGAWEVETAGKGKGKETELTVDGRSGKITQSAADHHEDDGEDDDGGQDD